MTELKAELKVSSKSMEAAMVARLFKDAIENDDPIVGHFVWIRDDGQKLDLGRPCVHPSFPNKDSAMRRLEARIGQWVSGERPGLDKNAIARLELSGATPFDFSMESFEKAALGDDGTLVIAVGHTKGVGREPMDIGRVTRLMLFTKGGDPVGRRQALLPIREIIQIQKRERAAQARRLERHDQEMEEGVDIGRQLSLEEDRQWADASREAIPARPDKAAPADRSKMMVDMAFGEVGRNMGGGLKAPPLPYAEAVRGTPKGQARLGMHDDFDAAFDNGEDDGLAVQSSVAVQAPAPAPAPAPAVEPLALVAVAVAPAGLGSQVRVEAAAAPIDPMFLKAVFPTLPDGCDEIHLTIERGRLSSALEALGGYGELEMRLASKGDGMLVVGLCVPCGQLPLLADFIAAFAKGGVMIKRGRSKPAETAAAG